MTTVLGPKYPSERITLELDFSDRLNNRQIVNASVSVSVAIGIDPTPDNIKDGILAATLSSDLLN